MDYPLHLGSGQVSISLHLLFETLAFFIGFRYFLYLKKKRSDPIPESNRVWIIIAAALGAFLFSRLVGSLENPYGWNQASNKWLYFFANKTIVGGLLGGLLLVELMKLLLREKSSSGDLFTYPLVLAMIIGRIGCLSSGIHEPTYGEASALPWAMDLGDGIPRHPLALYEIIFLGAIWIVLNQVETKQIFRMGVRFKLFMIAYLAFRFLIEFIKPNQPVFLSLSTIQLACLAGLAYYCQTIIVILSNPNNLVVHERPA
ncbi:prolipoprotein diacylglyceryl transferase family protein [Chryseolinea sp. T2]|uniref:prolipoprotein diacylglyceryl transferase n=1 Tax=Chryseolinea sp. T2 TaxID=3129255 RepID=UPI0030789EE3